MGREHTRAGSSFYFTVLVEGSELQIPPVSS